LSNLYQRTLSLSGINVEGQSVEDLCSLVSSILEAKIHGLCFSPYVEGQGPGAPLNETQIRERLAIIRPSVRWIRTFSCSEGHELIPAIAAAAGLKTMVGVWLDDNLDTNETELASAIEIAKAGHANIVAVGNEVLLRGELTEDELLAYMARVKQALPDIDIGYVDAYFKFVDHPRIVEACDVLLANCYPFWEGCPAEHALLYMKEMHRRVLNIANGRKVIVSETGWPNIGTATKGAEPSFENAIKYFVDTCRWAETDGVDIFYFSAFDEAWKVDAEGDVGAYWGLWDKDGNPKYV
jgi:glucan 1,3-beta-glucosidase